LVESGDISEEEALTHPASSQLSRFVGMGGEPLPEARSIVLEYSDRLLLCTDGLTRMVTDQKLFSLLSKENSLLATCDSLIAAANVAGGSDNITAVLISLPSAFAGD
jgi:protein phosphatase